jgi:hypothetical protein
VDASEEEIRGIETLRRQVDAYLGIPDSIEAGPVLDQLVAEALGYVVSVHDAREDGSETVTMIQHEDDDHDYRGLPHYSTDDREALEAMKKRARHLFPYGIGLFWHEGCWFFGDPGASFDESPPIARGETLALTICRAILKLR